MRLTIFLTPFLTGQRIDCGSTRQMRLLLRTRRQNPPLSFCLTVTVCVQLCFWICTPHLYRGFLSHAPCCVRGSERKNKKYSRVGVIDLCLVYVEVSLLLSRADMIIDTAGGKSGVLEMPPPLHRASEIYLVLHTFWADCAENLLALLALRHIDDFRHSSTPCEPADNFWQTQYEYRR